VHDWDFVDALTKLRGEVNGTLSARLHRIAVGGVDRRPVCKSYTTESGEIVETNEIERDENGELKWKDVWLDPSERSLWWLLARRQPEQYGNPEQRMTVQHTGDKLACGQTPQEVGNLLVDRFVGALATLRENGALTRPAQIEVAATPVPDPIPAEMVTAATDKETCTLEVQVSDAKPEKKPDPDDIEGLL
jgi:hypothetical protein